MDLFNTNSLLALLPEANIVLPYVGELALTPYLSAIAIFLGLMLAFKVLQMVVIARLQTFSAKTITDVDDVVIGTLAGIHNWVIMLVALYLSLQFFTLPDLFDKLLTGIVYFAVAYQVIEIALRFIEYVVTRFLEKDEDGDGIVDANAATASNMIRLVSRIGLWSLGAIFVLSNLGIEVTSLIAGLGIGGIAIAFALQGVLGDLFASFSIYFDKPFRIGDFIVIGTDAGTVEKVGIKSTRIRTLQGEELVVSNTELTSVRVQNFKKMQERRIVSQFGITYETPPKLVQAVDGIVEEIFASIDGARLDRVHFTTFADSALIFELVYLVDSSDYTEYLNKQQRFNFALLDKFAALGIDFAYPTQTIYTKTVA